MERKLNILHVTFHLKSGGTAIIVRQIVEGLGDRYNHIILCIDSKGAWADEMELNGKKVFLLRPKQEGKLDWFLPCKVASILKKEKIDIIHTHNELPNFYGAVAAKIAGVPIVINTIHGRVLPPTRIWMLTFKAAALITNNIIGVSEDAKRHLIEYCHIKPEKIGVILNGINCRGFVPLPDKTILGKHITSPEQYKIIGIVARMNPVKEHKTLLHAFSMVRREINNVKLVIVGDAESKEDLKNKEELHSLVQLLGIGKDVLFLGKRKDVKLLLNSFDLFILPSLSEGLSIALLEGMSCGLPVVVTNVGGNPEVVTDGEAGFVVPVKDADALTGAILKIIRSKELATEMGAKSRQVVVDKFSVDSMVNNYMTLYEATGNIKLK